MGRLFLTIALGQMIWWEFRAPIVVLTCPSYISRIELPLAPRVWSSITTTACNNHCTQLQNPQKLIAKSRHAVLYKDSASFAHLLPSVSLTSTPGIPLLSKTLLARSSCYPHALSRQDCHSTELSNKTPKTPPTTNSRLYLTRYIRSKLSLQRETH